MGIKKIVTKSEKEKKDKKLRIILVIIAGFLVLLMAIGPFGYSLFSGENEGEATKVTYNGIDFYKNGEWQASINNNLHSFQYSPAEVESIKVPASIKLEQFNNKPLYFDSDNPDLYYELARNLQFYVMKMDYACLNESDCGDSNYPIKTCSDNVIVIRSINQTLIKTDKNCTFIYGSDNIIKEGDAFLYKALGVN